MLLLNPVDLKFINKKGLLYGDADGFMGIILNYTIWLIPNGDPIQFNGFKKLLLLRKGLTQLNHWLTVNTLGCPAATVTGNKGFQRNPDMIAFAVYIFTCLISDDKQLSTPAF